MLVSDNKSTDQWLSDFLISAITHSEIRTKKYERKKVVWPFSHKNHLFLLFTTFWENKQKGKPEWKQRMQVKSSSFLVIKFMWSNLFSRFETITRILSVFNKDIRETTTNKNRINNKPRDFLGRLQTALNSKKKYYFSNIHWHNTNIRM